MSTNRSFVPPILAQKYYATPSAFTPENLLREARRQKRGTGASIPATCMLDPDGDIVRSLIARGAAQLNPAWACYHTQLYSFSHGGIDFGIVGCAVGASFAVLIAEEMFASGCQLLISMTSSGQIVPLRPPPYFIVIDRALRDEGTSYHYMAPSDFSHADPTLIAALDGAFEGFSCAGAYRRDLDDRRAVSRNPAGHRCHAREKPVRSRDGSFGALCLRTSEAQASAMFCPCHQSDGPHRRRFRKRGRRRQHRRAEPNRDRGRPSALAISL